MWVDWAESAGPAWGRVGIPQAASTACRYTSSILHMRTNLSEDPVMANLHINDAVQHCGGEVMAHIANMLQLGLLSSSDFKAIIGTVWSGSLPRELEPTARSGVPPAWSSFWV